MWRVEVTEIGRTPLPPIDIDGDELVIGSGEGCQLRLPARSVQARHLSLRKLADRPLRMAWSAAAALELDGQERGGGASGEATVPVSLQLGGYRLQLTEASSASLPTTPQRTESLVREMIRNIMGGAAPRLIVELGPAIGSSRTLAAPDSRLTVGRGDEADWVILDEELSRVHAALVRTWDGVRVVDLGSKNGTLVDGEAVPAGAEGVALRDGARITLGDVVVRYRDDAETYLADAEAAGAASGQGDSNPAGAADEHDSDHVAAAAAEQDAAPGPAARAPTAPPLPQPPPETGSPWLIGLGLAISALALAAAAWLLVG